MSTNEIQTKLNDPDLIKVASDFVNVASKIADIYADNNQNKFELKKFELEISQQETDNQFELQKQKQNNLQFVEEQKLKLEEQELKNQKTDNCHSKLFLVGCAVLLITLIIFGKLDTTAAFAIGIITGANINKTPQGIKEVITKLFNKV